MVATSQTSQEMRIRVHADTIFKQLPAQAETLPANYCVAVAKGSEFLLHSYSSKLVSGHVVFALGAGLFLGNPPRNRWYAYAPHVDLEGTEANNKPQDTPAKPASQEREQKQEYEPILLPGGYGRVRLSSPIIPGGSFTWDEATHGGSRIPHNPQVVAGIITAAKAMQEVRARLGDRPIMINSWYRDPATNRRVGGAADSRHMRGDAVDFVARGLSPAHVQKQLDPWWGSRGGLASASSFTHIDCRGYRARWHYGF